MNKDVFACFVYCW